MTTETPSPPPADTLAWCSTTAPEIDLEPCDAEMAGAGLHRVRTIVQLRRMLPLDTAARARIREVDTRSFDPGRDIDGLLEVNNAAFDWHPEQGGWDRGHLTEALELPWVDLEGILVHDPPDATAPIDGFCWTRIHPGSEPGDSSTKHQPIGEIWVIATHPDVHGTGLGPAMVAAGLDHLSHRGLRVANLYTEADNDPALGMYARMGFQVHERRGGYSPIDNPREDTPGSQGDNGSPGRDRTAGAGP